MDKLSKLSPYAKTYLAGAGLMGGVGGLGGAFLQTKKTLHGDKNLTPAQRKKRIRKQRMIGALGGAARGLALNHIAANSLLGTANQTKDYANILGAAGLGALAGGVADYKRLDDAALRANYPKEPGESASEYKQRLTMLRINTPMLSTMAAGQIALGGMKVRDDVAASLGGYTDARNYFNMMGGFKGFRQTAQQAAGATGSGQTHASSGLNNTRGAAKRFERLAGGMDLGSELKKAKGNPKAAAELRKKLKKQYRSVAMKHHPDRGGDPAVFQELDSAYRNIDDFLEKNSAWLRMYGHQGFYDRLRGSGRAR